jgi:integrase
MYTAIAPLAPVRPLQLPKLADLSGNLAALQLGMEGVRMNVPDHELIDEAIALGLAEGRNRKTLHKYRVHLDHYASYLSSVHGRTFYTAQRKHVAFFMGHLAAHGGESPDQTRLNCEWCRDRGYPGGRNGWCASTRKGYLSAVRFLYRHFCMDEDLPTIDPTAYIKSPKVVVRLGYTPTQEDVRKLLAAPGRPAARLLACWMFYAPSRLRTFADARWKDIDLENNLWAVVGKGDKPDVFDLHPLLARELRAYQRHMQRVALSNRAVRDALAFEESAYVLLTHTGRPMQASSLPKMLKRHAVRANVCVIPAKSRYDCAGGVTSRVSPHALRRAWATIALNDPHHPAPLDVVAEVLRHRDVSTTRRHYAPTKPERARTALRQMSL